MSDFTGTLTQVTATTTARGAPKVAFSMQTLLGTHLSGVAIDHVARDLIRRGAGARIALRGVRAPYSCTAFEKGTLLVERLMPEQAPVLQPAAPIHETACA